jgi:hypothetical protein
MRTKIYAIPAAITIALLAATSMQSTAQAYQLYRHRPVYNEHRDHDHGRGHRIFHFFRFFHHEHERY